MSSIAKEAPDLPFYYYHIPSMTGVEFSMYDFMVAAGPRIPNLMGVVCTECNIFYELKVFFGFICIGSQLKMIVTI